MKDETYHVVIEGTRPLLMHAFAPDFGKTGGRKKVPEPQDEAAASVYRDKDGYPAVPSMNILSCLRAAAVDYRAAGKGKKTLKGYVYSGVAIEPGDIPLKQNGNKDAKWTVDVRPVSVQRARVPRARPRFDEWGLEFNLHVLDPILDGASIKEIMEAAGKYVGLCDFRPLFGLFEVKEFTPLKV